MLRLASAAVTLSMIATGCTRSAPAGGDDTSPSPRRGSPDFVVGRPAMPEPPSGVPYVGTEGEDEHGYPLRRPDKIGLLSLLGARRFADLDAAFAEYQGTLEKDFRKESWPLAAVEAFGVADPELGPLLDAWIAASPDSFAPWVARGRWHYEIGWAARGHGFTLETTDAQMKAMAGEFSLAVADLEHAIELRPKLVAADHVLIGIERTMGSHDAMQARLDRGLGQCPLCFELHMTYTLALGPRWGGSRAEMDAFAKKANVAKNPKLAVLAGVSAWDRCRDLRREKKPEEALTVCDEALRAGAHPMFLSSRASVLSGLSRHIPALVPLDAALRLDPQYRDCLVTRARVRGRIGDIEGGAADLLAARRLDPIDPDTNESVTWYMQKLVYDAQEARKVGDRATAEDLLELAAALSPASSAVAGQREVIAAAEDAPDLAKKIARSPDDFDLRLELDHTLAVQGRFDEIVTMWDAFIDTHLGHAKAYRERSGAKWHAKDRDGAIADMQRACDLGLADACRDLPQMRARAGK